MKLNATPQSGFLAATITGTETLNLTVTGLRSPGPERVPYIVLEDLTLVQALELIFELTNAARVLAESLRREAELAATLREEGEEVASRTPTFEQLTLQLEQVEQGLRATEQRLGIRRHVQQGPPATSVPAVLERIDRAHIRISAAQRRQGPPEGPYTIPYGHNHYCDPAALAYVLRSDPDQAAKLLRQVSGKRSIHGVTTVHLEAALRQAQVRFIPAALPGNKPTRSLPTLGQWYHLAPPGEHIVCITGHYIVIDGHHMFDNRFHLGKPMALCPYLRRRVKTSWRILRFGEIHL